MTNKWTDEQFADLSGTTELISASLAMVLVILGTVVRIFLLVSEGTPGRDRGVSFAVA